MALRMPHALGERYSPLYFLAALGAGGLTANFFVWLMFWVPHEGRPVPTFEDVAAALSSGALPLQIATAVAVLGVAVFALLHVRLLVWNIAEYRRFAATPAGAALRRGNAETQLLALPLTLAMSVNVGFVIGLVFVPGLWSIVEWLFPAALAAFLVIGIWALRMLGDFYGRVLTQGGFDCAKNNSFTQMLPAFALSMVGVGLAAPAAMSATPWIAALSWLLASFFIVAAVLVGSVAMMLGLRAMMERGADADSAPSLWIGVPILTVLGIALMRTGHGAHAHLGAETTAADNLSVLATFLSAQLGFLLLGWAVLRRQGYFDRFVFGRDVSAGSWALVCPGVALGVMLHFFVNLGLVGAGAIAKFGVAYWAVSGLALVVQAATIWLVLRLAQRHFPDRPFAGVAAPAE
ncbi:MAG: hypothetical protein ACFCUS_09820 [Rubrimonas sp.]|uniref:TsoY family (seleno)protein n=1 Tax=Rubrimonas sp. TaxID=2036015 RepID=UPI002FDCB945